MTLNEADTRSKLIDPKLYDCGWTEDHIKREETAGEIVFVNGSPRRKQGRIDYTLRLKLTSNTQPVAVGLIEAKAERLPPSHGLEQAKRYARALHVPFVFTSNGHQFVEYDIFTNFTSEPQSMSVFPSPQALQQRYEQGKGFHLGDPQAKPLLTPYHNGEGARRFYQDAAIRAVLEHIAKGNKRALLSLATGTGKTFIAVNLLKRIADAGLLRKALFICDRDELRLQATGALRNAFGADAAIVTGTNPQKNARVLIATYQTLGINQNPADQDRQHQQEQGTTFLIRFYPDNYFSHIIIDECHRSGWGDWKTVFERNPEAIQIGLTATPRQLIVKAQNEETQQDAKIQADNYRYFGPPIYEYEMGQAMEDGYLAACEIIERNVDLDQRGLTGEEVLQHQPVNAVTGEVAESKDVQTQYIRTAYENRLMLPDRVDAMTRDLFEHFVATGGAEQKTIIFCVRDSHADAVAAAMNNLYRHWCVEQGLTPVEPYAFKCTAASSGNEFLPDFRGSTRHHFVATTVDLLTTGVDVPNVRNVVFFKYVQSPISFYQMVGRGTRLHVPSGKLMFRLYDYTNATRLFGEDFLTRKSVARRNAPSAPTDERDAPAPLVAKGFTVTVTEAGRSILTLAGDQAMPMSVEEYKQQLAAKLVAEAPTIDAFRDQWITPEERHALLEHLPGGIQSALLIQQLDELQACDLYDVLAELGYGLVPRTRQQRAGAFEFKHSDWLQAMPPRTAATVRALVMQFARAGTEGLENPLIFQTPEVVQAGGLVALRAVGKPADLLRETKARMFAA